MPAKQQEHKYLSTFPFFFSYFCHFAMQCWPCGGYHGASHHEFPAWRVVVVHEFNVDKHIVLIKDVSHAIRRNVFVVHHLVSAQCHPAIIIIF